MVLEGLLNGAQAVLMAGSELDEDGLRAVITAAPAGQGGDLIGEDLHDMPALFIVADTLS